MVKGNAEIAISRLEEIILVVFLLLATNELYSEFETNIIAEIIHKLYRFLQIINGTFISKHVTNKRYK
jgi:hypothetical protein